MAEFHSITNAHLGTGEPCKDVIELLEKLLEEAKRGEITGIATALVFANNNVGHNWSSGCASGDAMMLATHSLHTDMTHVWHSAILANKSSSDSE